MIRTLYKLNFSLFMGLCYDFISRICGVIKETSKFQYYFLFLMDMLEVKSFFSHSDLPTEQNGNKYDLFQATPQPGQLTK